jgi:hypothetical protein
MVAQSLEPMLRAKDKTRREEEKNFLIVKRIDCYLLLSFGSMILIK